jgi:hypothetical protein
MSEPTTILGVVIGFAKPVYEFFLNKVLKVLWSKVFPKKKLYAALPNQMVTIGQTYVETVKSGISTNSIQYNLRQMIDLINEGRWPEDKITPTRFTKDLGHKNFATVQSWFDGSPNIDVDELRKVCKIWGASFDAVTEGGKPIFSTGLRSPTGILSYLEMIKELKPKEIYLIMEKSSRGCVGIVLKMTDTQFLPLSMTTDLNPNIGNFTRATDWYFLIIELLEKYGIHQVCGVTTNSKMFDEYFKGVKYPGMVAYSKEFKYGPWWDVFIDLDNEVYGPEETAMWYGDNFVKLIKFTKLELGKRAVPHPLVPR